MNLGWICFFNIWHWRGGVADSLAIHWRSPGVEEWHFIPLMQISNCNSTEWSPICNGSRTEWSPIRFVIIRVINKIRRPRSGSPICLITSMITDRIGRHEVLLPINHNFNKICDIIGYFLNQNTRNSKFCFASSEKKKPFKRARDGAYCPIT